MSSTASRAHADRDAFRARLACALAAFTAGCAHPAARPDPAWDAAFTRTSGWNGGDIAHSIDLGDGRTLWLFGDSIFGPVRDGHRVSNASNMLRGAIAWHPTPLRGAPPDPDAITFAGPVPFDGAIAAPWIHPDPTTWPTGAWLWLMNDAATITRPDGSRRLICFATVIAPSGNPEPAWNFRRIGGEIITIDNPADPPSAWNATHTPNPLVTPTERHGEPPRLSTNHACAIVGPLPSRGHPDRCAVFGVRSTADRAQCLIVARADAPTLDRLETWEFFDGAAWTADESRAAPVCTGIPDELTIETIRRAGRDMLVMIHSEPLFGRRILARTAWRPEGPWSDPASVFEVTDIPPSGTTYAAKGHARLSRPGELLVSYIVNADVERIIDDPALDRPRFIRVPVSALPDPPREAR